MAVGTGELVGALPAHLLALLDRSATAGLAVLDSDGRYVRVNDAMARLAGRPAAEVLGCTLSDPGSPLPAAAAAVLADVLHSRLPADDVELATAAEAVPPYDELQRWMTSWQPVRLGNGEVAGAVVLVLPVGGERRSELLYRSLVAATAQVVWTTDARGHVIEDSPTWRAITGQTFEEFRGEGWLGAVHPDDRADTVSAWRQAVAAGEPFDHVYRLRTASGGYRWMRARGVPLPADGDAEHCPVAEWVGTCTDITDELAARATEARLQAAAAAAASRVEMLQRITARLAQALEVADVLTVLGHVSRDAVGAAACYLALAVDEGRSLSLVAVAHGSARTVATVPNDGTSPLARVVGGGEGAFLSSADALAGAGPVDVARILAGDGMRSWALTPLVASSGVAGALLLGFPEQREFSAGERTFFLALGSQTGQALSRATLYEQAADRARVQGLLSEASRRLAGSLERDEVLQTLTSVAVPDFAEWAAVHLLGEDGTTLELAALAHADPVTEADLRDFLRQFRVRTDQPHGAGWVVATGTPELLPTIPDEVLVRMSRTPEQLAALRALPLGSGLAVPLAARGRTFGALSLARSDRRYTDADRVVLEELAQRAAVAVDNAALFAAQRDAALTLQRSLLPQRLPELERLQFVARYIPGAAGTEVGGDWYDAIALPDGRVGIVVGDVMGRGTRAAAVMGQLRAALRGYALEGHPPAQVLGRLDAVVQAFDELQLTTCLYAVLEPVSGRLTVAAAGHLPPLVLVPGRQPAFLDVDPGLPLGVGGAAFADSEHVLGADSTLLLYTDGLVESRETLVDEGLRRLTEVLADAATLPAHDILETALVGMGRAHDHDDDVAVLVVRTAPADELPGHRRHESFELSPARHAAGHARSRLTEILASWGLTPDRARDAERDDIDPVDLLVLLTDELVTNSVIHARTPLRVDVFAGADRIRVEVADESPAVPAPRGPARVEEDTDIAHVPEGGRGLHLLDALASRWGVDALAGGKRVWFEVDLRRPT